MEGLSILTFILLASFASGSEWWVQDPDFDGNTRIQRAAAVLQRRVQEDMYASSSYSVPSRSYGAPLSSNVGSTTYQDNFRTEENDYVRVTPRKMLTASEKFGPCPHGYERTILGKCVEPLISKDLFLYRAPSYTVPVKKAYFDHKPRVHYNLMFLHAPSYDDEQSKPIVLPPPKQQTLVYLLSKQPDGNEQEVIEVPLQQSKPEVFFVDYKEGENPVLPGGIDLETALSHATRPGEDTQDASASIGENVEYRRVSGEGANSENEFIPHQQSGYSTGYDQIPTQAADLAVGQIRALSTAYGVPSAPSPVDTEAISADLSSSYANRAEAEANTAAALSNASYKDQAEGYAGTGQAFPFGSAGLTNGLSARIRSREGSERVGEQYRQQRIARQKSSVLPANKIVIDPTKFS